MKTLAASTRLKPSEILKLNRIAKRQGMRTRAELIGEILRLAIKALR